MTETLVHAPGTPSWVDLASPNLEASRAFYGALFDWDAWVAPQPEAGGYTIFLKNGKQVAGLGPIFGEGQPSAWATYVSTDNADETAHRVSEAGGEVVVPPMDVMDQGRMAVFRDPAGAHIAVWQGLAHQGAQLVNEPGTFVWNELSSRDIDRAKEFYAQVFDWGVQTSPFGETAYTTFSVDGKDIAGGMAMPPMVPAEVPSYWLVYFAVEDVDASTPKVQELGGSVIVPPMDIPEIGRFSVVQDPHGAVFALFQSKS